MTDTTTVAPKENVRVYNPEHTKENDHGGGYLANMPLLFIRHRAGPHESNIIDLTSKIEIRPIYINWVASGEPAVMTVTITSSKFTGKRTIRQETVSIALEDLELLIANAKKYWANKEAH
jgi:stress-induced morphogen